LCDSIRELCRRIASGDPEALSRLYLDQFDRLYATARRATGRDESFCLDVVHEAMLRVIRSIPRSIDTEMTLRAWLSRVVQACALDALRAERRRHRRETRASSDKTMVKSEGDTDVQERIEWLRRALRAQGGETAILLRLRHGTGWTLKRLGRAFNLSTGAVDGRINRALSVMREQGKENFDESR
jgi:RNA polymerase sigma factor (sigma-70 family)